MGVEEFGNNKIDPKKFFKKEHDMLLPLFNSEL